MNRFTGSYKEDLPVDSIAMSIPFAVSNSGLIFKALINTVFMTVVVFASEG